VSNSVTGNGFLFDPMPWIIIVASLVIISIMLWIPLIRHITKPLANMMLATEKIAKGNFDVSIRESRRDEIGRLAVAINRMTSQLSAFVKGQKRFLGDVAHELGSPMAGIQIGLVALEQRIDEKNLSRVRDIIEDTNHMSDLVHELLALSRIEIDKKTAKLEAARLLPIVQTAVKREFITPTKIIIDVKEDTVAIVNPELLTRAISNLIRNSIKYAGDDGPITILSKEQGDTVFLEVHDSGPGVPEEHLDQLFEPFFRLDASRDRDSGNVGLGLAIVKTCVENCKGQVTVRNLSPNGFAVGINLIRVRLFSPVTSQ
jgi:two-component system sensor histidine kinase CpxA